MPPLQFVWPKDGPRGRGAPGQRHRGFFGGMKDIMNGRGPDVFLQRRGDRTPIKPGEWGNWDSYHDPWAFLRENRAFTPRGLKRYDPHARKYRTWRNPTDWLNVGVDIFGPPDPNGDGYPHFTERECRRIDRMRHRTGRINPQRMGREWTHLGPKRFRTEHDWFWQEAHEVGENRCNGLPWYSGINPFFQMNQQDLWDLPPWVNMEV